MEILKLLAECPRLDLSLTRKEGEKIVTAVDQLQTIQYSAFHYRSNEVYGIQLKMQKRVADAAAADKAPVVPSEEEPKPRRSFFGV